MSADTPKRLGRGLEALIATAKQQRETADTIPTSPPSDLQMLRIADIVPNHFQPRRTFSEAELLELEASIRANGLLQPITVRPRNGKWELIAGERRFRAVSRLGWSEIPCIVRDFGDREMLTLALVENLQRSDLSVLEEAEGYQRLISEFQLTQQQIADAVGKDRTSITNLLRVLSLPAVIRRLVEQGQLSAGHARALLALKDERRQLELAQEAVARQLSVREVEARTRHASVPTGKPGKDSPATTAQQGSAATRRIEEQLRKRLQTDVAVQASRSGKGTLRIAFYSADDLERLMELIVGKSRTDFD